MTEQQNTLPDTDVLDFEMALQALNDLVKRMESGELSLEDTLKEFEQGVHLTHACQAFLKQAEQRVHLLDREGVEHPLAVDHEQ